MDSDKITEEKAPVEEVPVEEVPVNPVVAVDPHDIIPEEIPNPEEAVTEEIVNPSDQLPDLRMKGKRVLVIGVVDERKDFIWKALRRLGVELFAAGSRPKEQMKGFVKKYITYDSSDHNLDEQICEEIAETVQKEIGNVDGCICFWDTETPLADLVAARLGKHTIPFTGVAIAMSKAKTLEALILADENLSTAKYSSSCIAVECDADLVEYSDTVGFPAVMKTEYGAGAMGVKLVNSLEDAVDHFNHIQVLHEQFTDRAYKLGGTFKRSCVLMDYLRGSEHCVDLAIFHGELVCAFVTDKGPQLPPDVFKTTVAMPSLLEENDLEAVITAAFECCMALGLAHGVFDVDVMLTSKGPKLIEINPRVGGFCQREFILQCYNVDLAQLSCMVACDIKPHFASSENEQVNGYNPKSAKHAVLPSCSHYVGMYCYPVRHGSALKSTATPEILRGLHDKQELLFIQHEMQLREHEHELPFCTVAFKADTFDKAQKHMIEMCSKLGLETDDVSIKTLTDYFRPKKSA
ncbi:hypothetical protein BaRGS_00008963 [Batillaria attramentaria]|uniref:ATP-grasp domain-containing protein n=1 Tax=Batillaria attramentaria TaxID=370345 RepID=A0ABD0LLL0_9CAEN|nr:hypothetical protein BaRGS_034884 [Batillaria attramentaria]